MIKFRQYLVENCDKIGKDVIKKFFKENDKLKSFLSDDEIKKIEEIDLIQIEDFERKNIQDAIVGSSGKSFKELRDKLTVRELLILGKYLSIGDNGYEMLTKEVNKDGGLIQKAVFEEPNDDLF